MATTKIWDVRGWLGQVVHYVENPEKTGNPGFTDVDIQGLRDVMDYATQDYKTEMQYYVSGINCLPETARQQMMFTKKRWVKEGGIVAFHAYQSFAPGEVTPELAHEIGMKLAQQLWGDRFEVIIATHLDKAHLHSHFVLNSVSFKDGKRYNDCKTSYKLMRDTSDRLCREYGLSVIRNPQRDKQRSYDAWQAERDGKPTWWSIIRDDVDATVKQSMSIQAFIRNIKALGYDIKSGKYLAIKPEGKERFIRLKTLGENYSEDAIKYRILAQQYPEYPPRTAQIVVKYCRYKGDFKLMKPTIKGLRALYFYYLFLIRKAQCQSTQQVSFLLREDIRKMDVYSAQAKLLGKYKIETKEQLVGFISNSEKEKVMLISQRKTTGYRKRCETNAGKLEGYIENIEAIAVKLSKTREELKLAKSILVRSGIVQEKLKQVKAEEHRKDRQISKHRA